ncbi:J domain-containing protein [Leptothoe kymatousa]|uniref:Tetratricopeptide repeat protein n=1 Tax=Leptothoe kymatousa TAU-MAC 1615 TaxID=2364775 RepID=A0ABS5Y5U6_9CYAN|nr:J domain-containing protein [Leptothoe kymatousa]MBT9312719.1 tetratricopeptide repeat protein [Leptothoe kymatousa TAU-MAC 1615]
MTNAQSFQDEWITLAEKDPYAALGLSLNAEDRRILKRYRQIAKLLHPDVQAGSNAPISQASEQLIARIINPAYQRLKQEKSRSEALANMRFRVRQLDRQSKLTPSFESAQQLLRIPEAEVEVFYENTVNQLIAQQFDSTEMFARVLSGLSQLNLAFLHRKISQPIRTKRTGLVPVDEPKPSTDEGAAEPATNEPPVINYAEKYGIRARTYLSQRNYDLAIQELREALKIIPNGIELHSMLGQAYLMKKSYGMARAHLKRVLELNPNHSVALKYSEVLEKRIAEKRKTTNQILQPEPKPSSSEQGWFKRLLGR